MSLDAVDLFLEVIRAGSFSGAARATGIPVSTVSERIAALEARLGASLIKRTTRRLALTEAGAAYHEVAARTLAELRGYEAGMTALASGLAGRLRIASTIAMDEVLAPLITSYLRAYPGMSVELTMSSRNADLFGNGIDLAIRFGALRDDSGLVARAIGTAALRLVASPAYLANRTAIAGPDDLPAGDIMSFTGADTFRLENAAGETREIGLAGRFSANQLSALRHQAAAGLGIALVPTAFLPRELASGELVVVLPQWRTRAEPIHIVYLRQRIVPKRLRAFIDHLLQHFPRERFSD